jgi:hypothetical protein
LGRRGDEAYDNGFSELDFDADAAKSRRVPSSDFAFEEMHGVQRLPQVIDSDGHGRPSNFAFDSPALP